jgi:hypothetical protein
LILYLDTSALVKIYVDERGGAEVSFGCFDEHLRRAARRAKLRAPAMTA